MEDGWFECNGMGFEALFAGEEQGMNQMWGGDIEGQQLGYADFDTVENQWVDHELHSWESGGDPMGLEISGESMHLPSESAMSSTMTSTLTIGTPCPSANASPAILNPQGQLSTEAPSTSASTGTASAKEWHCDFSSCDKSFTHRHKLKYVHFVPRVFYSNKLTRPSRHRKSHFKPYRCPDPLCSKAFSWRRDLNRHQATASTHTGRRFSCQHHGCSCPTSGAEGGFTRMDNLMRHARNRHGFRKSLD
jgi:hypothetical protein